METGRGRDAVADGTGVVRHGRWSGSSRRGASAGDGASHRSGARKVLGKIASSWRMFGESEDEDG